MQWVPTRHARYAADGSFAGYIGSALDITERREMEQSLLDNQLALQRAYDRNQDLAGRLIDAQEAERARIARDLHDDLSQQLAGLAIMLSGLKRSVGKPDSHSEVELMVGSLQKRTSAVAEAVRNLSHELHPGVLKHAGLVATLRQHCAEVARHHGIDVTFTAPDEFAPVDFTPPCVYRVTQEALANVVRHARARGARVELRKAETGVELRVVDDGIGFVADDRSGRGLGLQSIDERVRLIRGTFNLESQPGRGTNLLVQVPLAAQPVSRMPES